MRLINISILEYKNFMSIGISKPSIPINMGILLWKCLIGIYKADTIS